MKITLWNGQQLSKPGFYSGVPMVVYHSGQLCVGPSLSSTGLRRIVNESEAHFYDKWPRNPSYDPEADQPTASMILGRAAHHLFLGEPKFAEDFVVTPAMTRDAKGVMQPWTLRFDSAKEWMDARAAEGRTVLTPAQVERVKGMALSLSKEPLIRAGALNGLIETTGVWQDKETGVWLQIRPDVIPTDSADIVDLKTTTSVAYHDVVRTIGDNGYFLQAALVMEGFEAITGTKAASFSLYFIESERPYCAFLYRLADRDLDLGRRMNRAALRRFVNALNLGVWPGPGGVQHSERSIELSDRQREIAEAAIVRSGGEQ